MTKFKRLKKQAKQPKVRQWLVIDEVSLPQPNQNDLWYQQLKEQKGGDNK